MGLLVLLRTPYIARQPGLLMWAAGALEREMLEAACSARSSAEHAVRQQAAPLVAFVSGRQGLLQQA